jgi:hypothetical protein
VILYERICKSLVAVRALPTGTPLCRANRHKYFLQLKHELFLTALSIKMPWVRTFFTNLEIVSPDEHVV